MSYILDCCVNIQDVTFFRVFSLFFICHVNGKYTRGENMERYHIIAYQIYIFNVLFWISAII